MAESSAGDTFPQLEVIEKQLVGEGYESARKTATDVIELCRLCPLLNSVFRPYKSPFPQLSHKVLCLEGPWVIRKGIAELQIRLVFPRSYPTRPPGAKVTPIHLPPNISLSSLGFEEDGTLKIAVGSTILNALKVGENNIILVWIFFTSHLSHYRMWKYLSGIWPIGLSVKLLPAVIAIKGVCLLPRLRPPKDRHPPPLESRLQQPQVWS